MLALKSIIMKKIIKKNIDPNEIELVKFYK